ncbi:hypothetical protein A2T82_35875 (plasmid) [Burkholderia cenocepacia]|nr:hypothetical protein A2T82_35875 [Burkholderia cenocepacia]
MGQRFERLLSENQINDKPRRIGYAHPLASAWLRIVLHCRPEPLPKFVESLFAFHVQAKADRPILFAELGDMHVMRSSVSAHIQRPVTPRAAPQPKVLQKALHPI